MTDNIAEMRPELARLRTRFIALAVAPGASRVDRLVRWITRRLGPPADAVDFDELARHIDDLWEHPDAFERGDLETPRFQDDPVLAAFHAGVLVGIDYEQAYPTGRNDGWPIPVDDRPAPDTEIESGTEADR